MIPKKYLLKMGSDMRGSMLHAYQHWPAEDAQEIARRFLFEIGQVMTDMHGRRDAASILYNVADAVTTRLPVEDWRLPVTTWATAVAPITRPRRIVMMLASWRPFLLGFYIGVMAMIWWGRR